MMQGTVSFRTCTRQVYIPAPYVAHLARQQYPSGEGAGEGGGPQNFVQAFEHWLFSQVVLAIGAHTII